MLFRTRYYHVSILSIGTMFKKILRKTFAFFHMGADEWLGFALIVGGLAYAVIGWARILSENILFPFSNFFLDMLFILVNIPIFMAVLCGVAWGFYRGGEGAVWLWQKSTRILRRLCPK